jgi:subtilisin
MARGQKTNDQAPIFGSAAPVVPTGNYIVRFKPEVSTSRAVKLLRRSNAGVTTSRELSSNGYGIELLLNTTDALLLETIGVAVVPGQPDASSSVRANEMRRLRRQTEIADVIPDFYVFAYDGQIGGGGDDGGNAADDNSIHEDTAEATWGISAVGADRCRLTGKGVKVAILDSGFDVGHPDFVGRAVKLWSAFSDQRADVDLQGHGTHCAGTAAGLRCLSENNMRYGIACEADIHIYKVLGDAGYGSDAGVLAGIEQALIDGCDVLSLSLGRSAGLDSRPNPAYERAATLALERGALIVAAAGNSSSRDLNYIAPIDYPANSPSIMAIAAVDSRLRVSNFSCGGTSPHSKIALAAPGAGVLSSVPMPRKYRRLRGTSMATPHVAGVACLWAEADNGLRGRKLWEALVRNAKTLDHPERDVGSGLVQAP